MKAATYFLGPSVLGAQRHWPEGPKELPPVDLDAMSGKSWGNCLSPVIEDGETITLIDHTPKPWQVAAIAVKDDVMWRAKILIAVVDRGGSHVPAFGEDQPDRLVFVAALSPLAVYCIAERDLQAFRTVAAVLGHGGFRSLMAGVSIEPEQWQAIQEALAA